ncbi:MAG: 16S rRNA pseudouridine(516) synthase [Caldimonas sp.]
MTLAQLLFSQGFGSRRECAGLVAAGWVAIAGEIETDPWREVEPDGLAFSVRGEPWVFHEPALLVMNKPAGHECSQKPKHHPSVYALLPAPLRRRDVQAIGRLDEDTTGVLLFTDDGPLIHRLTSPRHHVPKVYEVLCLHAVTPALVEALSSGVTLHDDPKPVRVAACEASGERTLLMTLTEGRYHQVKRMVAAAGNRVERLHRRSFGGVVAADVAAGAWRWLDATEVAALATIERT